MKGGGWPWKTGVALLLLATAAFGWYGFRRSPAPVDVPILMYHDISDAKDDPWAVSPDEFSSQMRFLKEQGYCTILPSELVAAQRKERALPERPIIITFDDGYLSAMETAMPLLQQQGFRAIVYLIANIVADDPSRRRTYEQHPCLTWPEIRRLQTAGVLTFGGHGNDHVRLDEMKDPAADIQDCRRIITDHGGFVPDSFCYPFGAFDDRVVSAVKNAGFTTGMTCGERIARTGRRVNLMKLPRLWVCEGRPFPLASGVTTGQPSTSLWRTLSFVLSIGWAAILVAAILIAWARPSWARWMTQQADCCGARRGPMLLLIGLGALGLLGCQLLRHFAFKTSALDLRLHEELVRNAFCGSFMHSDLLGHSFLSHHVSLIFPVFSFVYWLCPYPAWLMVIQGAMTGGAAWLLWRIGSDSGLRPAVAGTVALAFLGYGGMVTGYFQGFHQEVIAIFFLLGFFRSEQKRCWGWAVAAGLLALSCREDVALSLAVYGVLRCGRKETRLFGAVLLIVSIGWLVFSYGWIMPRYRGEGAAASVLDRWSAFGTTPSGIAWGMLTHPLQALTGLLNRGVWQLLGLLLFLPLASRRAVLPLLIPAIACTSSSFPLQAQLGGAYAALFVPYLMLGLVDTLARPMWRRWLSNNRAALFFCALLLLINVRVLPCPKIPAGVRDAHRVLATINASIALHRVAAQASILPHLGWSQTADMIGSDRTRSFRDYDVILLGETLEPWPLTKVEIREISGKLIASKNWQREDIGCLTILRRAKASDISGSRVVPRAEP